MINHSPSTEGFLTTVPACFFCLLVCACSPACVFAWLLVRLFVWLLVCLVGWLRACLLFCCFSACLFVSFLCLMTDDSSLITHDDAHDSCFDLLGGQLRKSG